MSNVGVADMSALGHDSQAKHSALFQGKQKSSKLHIRIELLAVRVKEKGSTDLT